MNNKQRYRMAVALAVGFILILAASWFVSYTIGKLNDEFKSVYQDRLVPAADITRLVERFYQNQLLLEQYLHESGNDNNEALREQILTNRETIDHLISKYGKTYLTNEEATYLEEFITSKKELQQLQTQVLEAENIAEAQLLYSQEYKYKMEDLLGHLHKLTVLQEVVGEELYLTAERQVKLLKMISSLVIAVSIFIALFIGTLLQANNKLDKMKPQKYHLN